MKVIKQTCSGIVSFRGVGFVEINGFLHPVLGTRMFDCGIGGTVRYVDEQIEYLAKPQVTMYGVLPVDVTLNAPGDPYVDGQVFLKHRSTGRALMWFGALEGIPLGGTATGAPNTFMATAPYRLNMYNARASGTVVTQELDLYSPLLIYNNSSVVQVNPCVLFLPGLG